MAFIVLNKKKLKHNYQFLNKLFKKHKIEWAIVTKLLCGNKAYLKELIDLGVKQICDSRVANLKVIKEIDSSIETIYIKPPSKLGVKNIIKYADISINTEFETIKLLNEEAKQMNKTHKIMIMIEMGELREGVLWDEFIDFYESVFNLSNIEVVGIGTNLTCLYGVLPNQDKLIQLSLYEQLIEAKFNKNIPYVSGGSSVTIPLAAKNLLPIGVNHFRVGETLFLGTDVYNDSTIRNMEHNVFQFFSEIIELSEKPMVPNGELGTNVEGIEYNFSEEDIGKSSFRAILDIGLLDVEEKHLEPIDSNIEIAGSSSDMIVLDLGKNPNNYKVGDLVEFSLNYMGTLSVLNSKYIEKRIQ
ncbi:MAG: alanine/ornithine racemase family PLP-dependent enzyme [Bacteroidales bacterium]|nr:alanine/ornithine racemase family PLP-dependent enzyme [Bacteroidales bacterium]